MKIAQFLESASSINFLHEAIPVESTAAELLQSTCAPNATIQPGKGTGNGVTLGVISSDEAAARDLPVADQDEWLFVRSSESGGIELYVSDTWFLYRLACRLADEWQDEDIDAFADGKHFQATFKHLRPAYDSLLNNHARTAKGFDPEDHIREMARQGYTHVEVNGYGTTFPYEKAAPGELLFLFYTYCPALDQFAYSKLNKGIYPYDYLQANLNKLKHSAQLAEKYGLRAGILSFEPRSVPDELLSAIRCCAGHASTTRFAAFARATI